MKNDFAKKINNFMINDIKNITKPVILEFGVRKGISTQEFIKICEKNDGHLYSIDVDDCSNISNSSKWTFIQSRDDDFEKLEAKLPNEFDLIFLDSFHNADHISKIFYYYFKKLKKNGLFFFDDISWLPYLRNTDRENFNCEINNLETFEKILDILFSNQDKLSLFFSFEGSGMAKIVKLKEDGLQKSKKIKTRKYSFKNFLRRFYLNIIK
tara:strand:- start:357 stop:989 length:633 start_codon:yes stop_codon:yes gene_type:complete